MIITSTNRLIIYFQSTYIVVCWWCDFDLVSRGTITCPSVQRQDSNLEHGLIREVSGQRGSNTTSSYYTFDTIRKCPKILTFSSKKWGFHCHLSPCPAVFCSWEQNEGNSGRDINGGSVFHP